MDNQDLKSEAIAKAVNGFDFQRAAAALEGCGWRYVDTDKCPSSLDLRKIAARICASAVDGGAGCTCSQGPMEARVTHCGNKAVPTLELTLRPIRSSAVYVDEDLLAERFKKRPKKATPIPAQRDLIQSSSVSIAAVTAERKPRG